MLNITFIFHLVQCLCCNATIYVFLLQRADAKLSDAELSLRELCSRSRAVAEFFCEDPSLYKLEECCSIFSSFCNKFEVAIQVRLMP